FSLVLGPDLKPQLRAHEEGPAGRLRDDLPKPSSKDDPALAGPAVADWKLLKKQLREVLKVQVFRLEQAMVTGRRWSVDEFRTLLLGHPLLSHLVRRLLWGGYADTGRLLRAFRATEEGDLAGERDEPVGLDGVARVGLVHPLSLSADQKQAWGEVF